MKNTQEQWFALHDKRFVESIDLFDGEFSISAVQRKLKLGYNQASYLVDRMLALGVIEVGSNPWRYRVKAKE